MSIQEEKIAAVADFLSEWNPLGDRANSMQDLEGYRYEAMDILSSIRIAKETTKDAVSKVLSQAFKIVLDEKELNYYSTKIDQIKNDQ